MSTRILAPVIHFVARQAFRNLRVEVLEIPSRDFIRELRAFRHEQYAEHCAYLNRPEILAREVALALDERSTHFVVRDGKRILGAVRLTPAPFESSVLTRELGEDVGEFAGYRELSRLLVRRECRGKRVCDALLVAAGSYGYQKGDRGMIAICRPKLSNHFSRYGFLAYCGKKYSVPERGSESYSLMWADYARITRAVPKAIFN